MTEKQETHFEHKDRVHFVGEYSFYCPSCGPIPRLEDNPPDFPHNPASLRTIEIIDQGDEWKVVCGCDVCELIVNVFVRQP